MGRGSLALGALLAGNWGAGKVQVQLCPSSLPYGGAAGAPKLISRTLRWEDASLPAFPSSVGRWGGKQVP